MTDTDETATSETSLAARDSESSIELLPPVQPGAVAAYDALDRHVHAVKKAQWLAEAMCQSQYVPAKFQGKPADGTAAILFGAEVGLSPIASLRSVIVIHGMPGFEARTMKAILMGHGYRFRQVEATREVCRVVAQSPNGDEAEAEITIDDCKLEGWVPQPAADLDHDPNPDTKTDWAGEWKDGRNGKYYVVKGNMKYITSPRTMLIAKATAAVCRDIAPHLLLGMPAAEDMQDWDDSDEKLDGRKSATPPPSRPGGRGSEGLRARAKAAQQKQQDDDNIVDAEEVADPGHGGGNEAGEGAEPSSGATSSVPPPDQESDLRKQVRQKLNEDIAAEFRVVDLLGDDNAADRLVVIRAILGDPDVTVAGLTDDQLQKLRNELVSRRETATIADDIREWINAEDLRQQGVDADGGAK